jgi:small conductance mechanosensitive channel
VIAAKDTLQNIASKYFSDIYVPYKVGDLIKVKNFSGRVIEINPISTILLTENEELISIPNALFLREIMVNISPHAWKEIMIPMVISKEVDPPEFESEVLESCNKLKMYFDERFLPIIAIKKRTGKSVELTLTLLVKEPSKKDAILSEINERVNEIIERMKKRE